MLSSTGEPDELDAAREVAAVSAQEPVPSTVFLPCPKVLPDVNDPLTMNGTRVYE